MIQPNERKLHLEPEKIWNKLWFIGLTIMSCVFLGYLYLADYVRYIQCH